MASYVASEDFPPKGAREGEALVRWYKAFAAVPMKAPEELSAREKELLKLSAEGYVRERRAGRVSCEEYTSLLVRRARYYRYMNQWTFRSYELFDSAVALAKELDLKAEAEGVEALAPLYGLPIPMKGTAAVVAFPSGAGVGILSGYVPVKDSALTELIYARQGVVLGTTNTPEFACSVNTANVASGQTRNPYDHRLSPGGSSGGAGSAVSMHMCPVAVSEDTGGSTRVPALFNGLFGFDPARNHYPNEGNCGMSFTKDQLGVLSRSMEDLLFYDQALLAGRHQADELHSTWRQRCDARPLESFKVGLPKRPWVVGGDRRLDATMQAAYEAVQRALHPVSLCEVDWEGPEATAVASQEGPEKHVHMSFLGQIAQFVYEYLDAPVSLKEILEDTGTCGEHRPDIFYRQAACDDETKYRYALGPFIKQQAERYNRLLDSAQLDVLLVPAAYNATPDLWEALTGTMDALDAEGRPCKSSMWKSVYPINEICKCLHIPKLSVPTGLTDGRPTGVQLWGRAVAYEEMFDDSKSTALSVEFLHVARRLVDQIHSDPTLRRVTPAMAQDL